MFGNTGNNMMTRSDIPIAVVVNDNHAKRAILAGMLRRQGIEARDFEDVETALVKMNPNRPPNLIVTDLYMPGIDGWRFCRLLRSTEYSAFNHIPIMVVSDAYSGEDANRITADLGANIFLPMPKNGRRFIETVQALLEGRSVQALPRVLVVGGNRATSLVLARIFAANGYESSTADSLEAARNSLAQTAFELAALDFDSSDGRLNRLLRLLRDDHPECVPVVIAADPRPDQALAWMRHGAAAYLRKPFDPASLVEICAQACRERAFLRIEDRLEERTRHCRSSEAYYRALFESVNDAILVHEIDGEGRPGKFVAANSAACSRLGYSREEMMDLRPQDIAPKDAYRELETVRRKIATTGSALFETEHIARDGRLIPVESHVRTFELDGKRLALSIARNQTERLRTEALMRKKSEERHLLLDTIDAQVWYLSDIETYGAVNRAHADFLGFHPREIAYKKLEDFLSPKVAEVCRAGNIEVFETGRPVQTEEWIPDAQDRQRLIRITKTPRLDMQGRVEFVVCAGTDITERKKAEADLRYRVDFERLVGRIASDLAGASGANVDSTIDRALASLGNFTGADRAYVFQFKDGDTRMDNTHEWHADGIEPQIANLKGIQPEKELPWFAERIRKREFIHVPRVSALPPEADRERDHFSEQGIRSLIAVPTQTSGRLIGFLGFDAVRDLREWTDDDRSLLQFVGGTISYAIERKRGEEERLALERRIQQANKAESMERMAGAIAHHFNNYLAVVLGNLELADEELDFESPVQAYLSEATAGARRLASISQTMLTYLGMTPAKPGLLDLADRLVEFVPALRRAIARPGVSLALELPSRRPAIRADSDRVRDVLARLVTNAAEAIGDGSGTIRVSLQTVAGADLRGQLLFPLDFEPHDVAYACLEVADNGCGITEAERGNLFDPFYSTKQTGRGLGLPVVLGMMRASSGAVSVSSAPGKETVFRVFWPVCGEPVAASPLPSPAPSERRASPGGQILLVDSDPRVRQTAETMLRRLGYDVRGAENYPEALAVLRERDHQVRCALLDLGPRLEQGWIEVEDLRRRMPDVPMILTSSWDESRTLEGARADAGWVFLCKPYQKNDLLKALDRALGEAED